MNEVSWGEGEVFPVQSIAGAAESIADAHAVSFDRAASSRGPQINIDGAITGIAPNDPLIVSGSGLSPNEEFEIRFEDQVLYGGTADSEGAMSAEVSVPADAQAGIALVFVKEVGSVDAFDFVVIQVE